MPCLPWCVCSLRQFWTASLPSCRDTMKGLSSLQSSPSQWVAMFLFLDTQSCFFHRSQRKPVICWKLNLRSWTSVSFFFSPPRRHSCPPKGESSCQICGSPCESVDLPAALLFTLSVTVGLHICVSSAFRQSRRRVEHEAARKCKADSLHWAAVMCLLGFCHQFVSLSLRGVKHVWKIKRIFLPSAAPKLKITHRA